MNAFLLVTAFISLSVGTLLGWFIARANSAADKASANERAREIERLTAESATQIARIRELTDHAQATKQDLAGVTAAREAMSQQLVTSTQEVLALRTELAAAQQRCERLTVTLEKERESTASQLNVIQDAQRTLHQSFTTASQQALQTNNEHFLNLAKATLGEFQQAARGDLEQRQKSIDEMVKPVREGLTKVETLLQTVDRDRATSHATLQENLRHIAEAHHQLAGNTQNLVQALRAPQGRGRWGEMQLRRVVELAGMVEHCDFLEQESITSDDRTLRPDLIVHLPLRKLLVVDAKAPLSAYLEALNATDDAERNLLLDKHGKQVRTHIEQLSSKNYAAELTETPNFVFMFLPGEDFFAVATQRDPSLLEFAIGRNVIPASPTTLISLLKAVAYGWQQERIAEKAEEIRNLGQTLYERIAILASHMIKMRKGLDGALGAYNNAVGSLESRVLPVARRFRELGAHGDDEIEVLEAIDTIPRVLSAPELVAAESRDVLSPIGERTPGLDA